MSLQTLALGVAFGATIVFVACSVLWWASDPSPAQAVVFRRAIAYTACLSLLATMVAIATHKRK